MEMMTAEQAIEAAKGLTFEKVWATMMEDRHDREKRMEESDRKWEKQMRESDRKWEKQMQESDRKWEKQMQESDRKWEKRMEDLSKNLGGLGNSIGDFTESMFKNELWNKFSDIGIPVTRQSERVQFGDHNKRVLTEVDVLIENGEYAIVVEIKTNLRIEFVDNHLKRIEIVRRYLDERGDKRKLIGAVAGGTVTEEVMNYAQEHGLYVILQNGDSVSIADVPQGFKAREW